MNWHSLRTALLRSVLITYRLWCARYVRRFEEATMNLRSAQRRMLRKRIDQGLATDFGRDHHFSSIRTVGDFRRHVPIMTYEDYLPYIERLKRGRTEALLGPGQQLVMFALTSGTQAARKFIPVTTEFLRLFRQGWTVWGVKASLAHHGLFRGRVLQMASDWNEFQTEAGIPCGSISGLIAVMQNPLVRRRYCVPPEVGLIKDVIARHYTTLRLAIPERITYATTANPSTFVNLARLGDQYKELLIRDIHDGTLSSDFDVPQPVRDALAPRINRPDPEKARWLEQIVAATGHLLPKDYWPELRLLGNWTGGAVGAYLRHYPKLFGNKPVRDIGLIASEGRMTIPVKTGTPAGVLDVLSNYYEFIPEEEIESAHPTVLEAHELEEGRNYFIILTTPSGFYRYNISDVVRVTGWYNQAPVLEFLNKGSHFSSITGEKLAEAQVSQAVDRVLRRMSLALTAFTLAPVWDDQLPFYALLIERSDISSEHLAMQLARAVDEELQELNSEYRSKRETRRLGAVRIGWLPPGAWERFFRQRLAQTGGTAEQYKHPCLVSDFKFVQKMPVQGALVEAA